MASSLGLNEQIARASGVELKRVGSLELVAFEDVGRFLATARLHGFVVLGVEGFRIVAGRAMPDMDAIADFSSVLRPDQPTTDPVREAADLVREVGEPSMFFEFVLERRGETA